MAAMQGFLGILFPDFVITVGSSSHLRGPSPVACTYHLFLLLQHEETILPACLGSTSEESSPAYHVIELYQSILCQPFAMVE